jgi:hypothetical protein
MTPTPTARDRQAAAAAALLGRGRDKEGVPRPGITAQRTDPIRVPISLPPELHREFKRWGIDAAAAGSLAEVPMAAAVRALVRLLTIADADELAPNSQDAAERQALAAELTERVIKMVKAER